MRARGGGPGRPGALRDRNEVQGRLDRGDVLDWARSGGAEGEGKGAGQARAAEKKGRREREEEKKEKEEKKRKEKENGKKKRKRKRRGKRREKERGREVRAGITALIAEPVGHAWRPGA